MQKKVLLQILLTQKEKNYTGLIKLIGTKCRPLQFEFEFGFLKKMLIISGSNVLLCYGLHHLSNCFTK